MSTRTYIENMLKCKDFLEKTTNYATLVKALTDLTENIDFFEKYIDENNPFKQHFYDFFCAPETNFDECFAVQEDVAIFFREKLLRLGIKNMSPIELEVLQEFEALDHDLDSCVASWYYEKLPLMMYSELGESIGYKDPAWKTWKNKSRQI